jgi:serine/threonine protein kinase
MGLMTQGPFDSPKSFGPFELLEKVGRGGVATVYKARHKTSGNIVAIKIAPRMLALDPGNFERFKREFTTIRHLRHPHLVEALDFGEEKNVPYLVQEFVAGLSLENRLQRAGPVAVPEALSLILQVADGLRYLHQNDILHRDIKPGNILIDDRGQAKLGDFGLSKKLLGDSVLTRSKQAMGTLDYGAPEQFEDARSADFRCDLYSLAATLYTVLTGQFAFGVGSHMRILQRKLQNRFVPLRELLPTIPPALCEFVTRSLHCQPEFRPGSIDSSIAVLQGVRDALKTPQPAVAVGTNPPAKDSASGAERRTTVRVVVTSTAGFVPFHQHKRGSWKTIILDVSAGGLCLETTVPFPVNTVLEVMPDGGGTSYLVQVRWTKPTSGQAFILGCSFVRPLADGAFEEMRPSGPQIGVPPPSKPGD